MKRLLLALIAAFAIACNDSRDPVTPPPVNTRNYVLTNLSYEDAVPGQYTARISDSTFSGGPAVLAFGTDKGELQVATVLTALFAVQPDTTQSARVQILPAGSYPFSFAADTAGVVSLSLEVWFNGGTLSDSTYVGNFRQCYNEDCSDHTFLSFRWVRQ